MKKASPATPDQKRRFEAMKLLGCYCCIVDGVEHKVHPDIHHFTRNNKRIGHWATAPLCEYHHDLPHGFSWHFHRRAFREKYGSDTEVVARVNLMLMQTGLYE